MLGNRRRSAFMFVPERALTSVAEHERLLRLIEAPASSLEIEVFAREHKMRTLRDLLTHSATSRSAAGGLR